MKMKKLFTVLAIALFTISVNAQETKTATKREAKKEAKKSTVEAKATIGAEEKEKSAKSSKSCCAKKE